MNTHETIHQQVNANAVVLYMKGTPQFPQCGFSGSTVQMLQACGVKGVMAVDALASALFAIEHVRNVFYVDRWLTVTQDGNAD